MSAASRSSRAVAEAMELLMPLHFFHEKEGRPLPVVEFVQPGQMPRNERELLVHDHDMTSALAEYHGSALRLHVVASEESPDYLLRMVVLERLIQPCPVEFGAIGIRLEAFEEPARRLIRLGEMPLGAILESEGIPFISQPRAYFRTRADARISTLLAEPEGTNLWGRCNALADGEGVVFADIVEVLPRALAPVPPTVHRNAGRHLPAAG